MKLFWLISLLSLLSVCNAQCPAEPCNPSVCNGADCACAVSLPENVAVEDMPQLVYLSFDDAMTPQAESQYYSGIFDGTYTNPNGCPIRATHFITHQYNDYSLNAKYYNMGHEFASHGITHRANTTYWKTLPTEGWTEELQGCKTMLGLYAGIPETEVIGTRAPYLQGGGDEQFEMMAENGFKYDCTMPNRQYGFTNLANGIWPYSLDYGNTVNCQIAPCPTCSFPGVWVQPILDLEDMWLDVGGVPGEGQPCDMLDSCTIPDGGDPQSVFDMMMKNFLRAWNGTTHAPIGFYMHAAWFFGQDWHYEGYKMFLEEITTKAEYKNTWIVPVREGMNYRMNPVPLSVLDANEYPPFQCDSYPQIECARQSCSYFNVTTPDFTASQIIMTVCGNCPAVYPWLGNPEGDLLP